MTIPSIDQNICGQWTEQDLDLYNKLPYYFAKSTTQFRKFWNTWDKLLGKISWTPNMGEIMRTVMVEPTPVMRQWAAPALLRETPRQDVINVRERTVDTKIRIQQFVSPHIRYLSTFQDFLKGNIKPTRENLDRQIVIFEEQFYRSYIFNWSPYVYVAGYGLVSNCPVADPAYDLSAGKTLAWLQAQVAPNVKSHLTLRELFKAMTDAEEILGMTPFEGSGQPGGDNGPLNETFCLVHQPATWNSFLDDPWLKENRPLNMNIVTDSFKGMLFNKIRCKAERYGMRIKMAADFGCTFPAPEEVELDANSPEYLRTKPALDYAKNAQLAVSFLVGGSSYDMLEVGPPPSEFTGGGIPEGFNKMNWNGMVQMNKNFLVPCKDANGNNTYDTNSWGHYLRLQAEAALGIRGCNKFNVLPIIHARREGILTTVS